MRVFIDPTQEILGGEEFLKLLKQKSIQVVSEKEFDVLILDGSSNNLGRGYLAALALAQRKPVLCLIPKGFPIPEVFAEITAEKRLQKLFKMVFYTNETIDIVLDASIKKLGLKLLEEKPSIKFTLRITPSMERYLEYKSKQTGLSKADFLRREIQEKLIDQDDDYQAML